MTARIAFLALGVILLTACTAPYRPSVPVYGAPPFQGIAHYLKGGKSLDIVIVHGMCSHTKEWANEAIDEVVHAIDQTIAPQKHASASKMAPGPIEVVKRTVKLGEGTAYFSAILWSPLTAQAKSSLYFDQTGSPTDCTAAGECKPRRARLNGLAKDGLLNDCLSDALIYRGRQDYIRNEMAATLEKVLAQHHASHGEDTPLVLITESLGSKLTFDALEQMRNEPLGTSARSAGQRAIDRTRLLIMAANQIPLLNLMSESSTERLAGEVEIDPLARFLTSRSIQLDRELSDPMTIVALNDPNDLLSYRLQPSRYASSTVKVADILVSNRFTWFGLLEEPFGAHTGYLNNPDVARIIACGSLSERIACK